MVRSLRGRQAGDREDMRQTHGHWGLLYGAAVGSIGLSGGVHRGGGYSTVSAPWIHVDLFSGIGGFSLAARWTGRIETKAFVEIEPFCCKVLKHHWPGVPILGDIHGVTADTLRGLGIERVD